MNTNKLIGFILVTVSCIFAVIETKHFGNNWLAQSKDEYFCDLISFIVGLIGIIIYFKKPKH